MKYIKKYEDLDEPEIGDYVAVDDSDMKSFVGKISDIMRNQSDFRYQQEILPIYRIQYRWTNAGTNIPVTRDKILVFSKNKSDVENFLNAEEIYNV